MKDLTILVDTEPCRPADMLSAVAAAGVDVVAGCLFPRLGGRVAHIAVDDHVVDRVEGAIGPLAGVIADQRDCIVVPAGHDAQRALSALVGSGIGVSIAYFGPGGELVVGTADPDAARAVLSL
jgi:hypothetical protein